MVKREGSLKFSVGLYREIGGELSLLGDVQSMGIERMTLVFMS